VSAAPHKVLSTTIKPIASLLWLFVVVPFAVVAAGEEVRVVLATAEVVVTEELVVVANGRPDEVVDGTEALLMEVSVEERYAGGGMAVEVSFRAPVPHGIFSPVPGWVGFEGGTELPSVPTIVKRVVQVFIAVEGLVNW